MQFQASHIPADVDTYEKLIVWALDLFEYSARGKDVIERPPNVATGDSGVEKVIAASGPDADTNNIPRRIFRVSMPLAADATGKSYTQLYQAATDVTTADVPVNYIA